MVDIYERFHIFTLKLIIIFKKNSWFDLNFETQNSYVIGEFNGYNTYKKSNYFIMVKSFNPRE